MKSILLIIISVLLSSLITLGLFFNQNLFLPNQQTTVSQSPTESTKLIEPNQNILDLESKVTALEASYSALLEKQTSEVTAEQTSKTNTITKYVTTSSTPTFTNQVIYLGSATTNNRTWTQTGVEVTLNSTDYPDGTRARFEAGLKIIGGEAWARLVNKTTGAIITATEVNHNTNTTTWKGSPAFALHPGNNTYVVELRSSSGETAVLDGSRIILEK